MDATITLPQTTVKRLLSDIRTLYKSPLHDHGIYYSHDETNILKGYALIVGPKDTPYNGGYYLFEFHYPANYPFAPPRVIFCTNQNKIRFNPNLYTDGKVCVSILNTWAGEQWTSCQTLTSVLLSLITLLCNNPLLNEPSVTTKETIMIDNYNKVIEYANIDIAVCNILMKNSAIYLPFFDRFYSTMIEHWHKNKDELTAFCQHKIASGTKSELLHGSYSATNIFINYTALLQKIQQTDVVVSSSNRDGDINDINNI